MYISQGGRPIEAGYQRGFHQPDPPAHHVLSRRLPRPVRLALVWTAVLAFVLLVLWAAL